MTERQEFEKWLTGHGVVPTYTLDGDYSGAYVSAMWEGWSARAKLASGMAGINDATVEMWDEVLRTPPASIEYRRDGKSIEYWIENGECRRAQSMAEGKTVNKQVGGSHYKDMPVQPIKVMQSVLTKEEYRGYLKGNIIKYAMRAGHKPGSDNDPDKAQHYMEFLTELDNERCGC